MVIVPPNIIPPTDGVYFNARLTLIPPKVRDNPPGGVIFNKNGGTDDAGDLILEDGELGDKLEAELGKDGESDGLILGDNDEEKLG